MRVSVFRSLLLVAASSALHTTVSASPSDRAVTHVSNIDQHFTVSASSTDPLATHVQSVEGGLFSLYLWLVCSECGDICSLKAWVDSSYPVVSFEVFDGIINIGSPEHPICAIPRPQSRPWLMGRWTVSTAPGTSGFFCLTNESGTPRTRTNCCDLLGDPSHDAGVTGFSVGEATSCFADTDCDENPVGREEISWGRAKVSFRAPSD